MPGNMIFSSRACSVSVLERQGIGRHTKDVFVTRRRQHLRPTSVRVVVRVQTCSSQKKTPETSVVHGMLAIRELASSPTIRSFFRKKYHHEANNLFDSLEYATLYES